MSKSISIGNLPIVILILLNANFVKCASAQDFPHTQERMDISIYGIQLLSLSERDEYLAHFRNLHDQGDSSSYLLEQQKLIRLRALASGVSWICLDFGKSAWVQAPKDAFPSAAEVASHECAINALKSQ